MGWSIVYQYETMILVHCEIITSFSPVRPSQYTNDFPGTSGREKYRRSAALADRIFKIILSFIHCQPFQHSSHLRKQLSHISRTHDTPTLNKVVALVQLATKQFDLSR
jgi:hypothetical protein